LAGKAGSRAVPGIEAIITRDQARLLALRGQVSVSALRLDKLVTGNAVHHYGFNY